MAEILSLRCRRTVDSRPGAPLQVSTAADRILGLVAECVGNIAADERANIELSRLGPHLLHLMTLVGRKASVEAAADALYGTAQRIVHSAAARKLSSAERLQHLEAAYRRLRSRVLIAEPIDLDPV